MKNHNKEDYKICIVGLGYVGLPLAARFSLKGFDVTGFDIKEERINQLKNKVDINNDISDENLETLVKNSKLTSNIDKIKGSNIFIITVPTPINKDKSPDLQPLIASSELVGDIIKKESIVIYESTVYPGVTDEVCTPILEKKSGLIFNALLTILSLIEISRLTKIFFDLQIFLASKSFICLLSSLK